jgi:N,N'-diacetyllegionaminate synthase
MNINFNNTFSIQGRNIGNKNPCFIIAEIAQAHEGSLGLAHSYIDAVANAGADAIKFQTHIAEAESTKEDQFRVNFSYEDKNRYDYWKRMEFTLEQWFELKKHCDELNLVFLSSPFSIESVNLLEKIDIHAWKIGSGEINNPVLLELILDTNKPILLSTGMSDWNEIDTSIGKLIDDKIDCAIFQCTSKYPTEIEEVGLNVMKEMKERYNIPTGLSDHSGRTSSAITAIAKDANLLEVHVVFDKAMFGPDVKSSLTLKQLREVVNFRNDYYKMITNPVDKDLLAKELVGMRRLFNKSVVLNKMLTKGATINRNDLAVKKPGIGIPAQDINECVGKKIKSNLPFNHILVWEDLE